MLYEYNFAKIPSPPSNHGITWSPAHTAGAFEDLKAGVQLALGDAYESFAVTDQPTQQNLAIGFSDASDVGASISAIDTALAAWLSEQGGGG